MLNPVPPPSDVDAEMALLGSVLLDPSVLGDIAPLPFPSDFYVGRHAALWRVVLTLHRDGTPPDALLAFREAERQGVLDTIGGRDAIATLAGQVSSPVHAKHYAGVVRDKARARALLALARNLEAGVLAGEGSADCLKTAWDGLCGIGASDAGEGATRLADALYALLGSLHAKREEGTVALGYPQLDDLMAGGLHRGEVTVVAARPGAGKTNLALNVAANAAEAGVPVLIYSMEMTKASLARSLLARRAKIPTDRIRKGAAILGRVGCEVLSAAANDLGNLPIWLNDACDIGVAEIRAEAGRLKAKDGLGLVVVDYIGLLNTGEGSGSRQEDVAALSRGLKVAAKDLDLPILVLAQLSRKSEEREDRRPRLSDLRESGQIEADADVVMMLHRPGWYSKIPSERDVVEVVYAKNRYGPCDTLRLIFEAETSNMRSPMMGDFDAA